MWPSEVSPGGASSPGAVSPRLRPVATTRRLRVVDIALFYGERSGGIRTYLDAKARHAARTGAFEHHVVVPGRRERHHGTRHELRSLQVAASNGYRLPLGVGALQATLRAIRPDVVMLHDPFWGPLGVTRVAHDLGAAVVAVHHSSSDLDAAGLPGPTGLYRPLFQSWFRHAYERVDGVMSAVDPFADSRRGATLPLRFGLHPAFRPQKAVRRGEHVLYVGRLGREKGVMELLEAAALAPEPWPLRLVGTGVAADLLRARAARLGLGGRVSFEPFVADRAELARIYAEAACVVMPGRYETFGLVALEAAASGARVVACANAPSSVLAGALAERFAPGDTAGLLAAIERARSAPRDLPAAARLAARSTWERAFAAELSDLERLAA